MINFALQEDEFEGFTQDDVKKAQRKLKQFLATMAKDESSDSGGSPDSSPIGIAGRRGQRSLEPRVSFKDILQRGKGPPIKRDSNSSYQGLSAQDETRQTLTKVSQGKHSVVNKLKLKVKFKDLKQERGFKSSKFKPRVIGMGALEKAPQKSPEVAEKKLVKHKKKVKVKPLEDDPDYWLKVAQGSQLMVQKMLKKDAKKSIIKSPPRNIVPVRRQFVLPSQSSRSARTIKPNKRFLEDEMNSRSPFFAKKIRVEGESPSKNTPIASPTSSITSPTLLVGSPTSIGVQGSFAVPQALPNRPGYVVGFFGKLNVLPPGYP